MDRDAGRTEIEQTFITVQFGICRAKIFWYFDLIAWVRVIPDQDLKSKPETEYFAKPVYLTVSGQLHLEAICNGIAKEGE
jgi:hypothetical protein